MWQTGRNSRLRRTLARSFAYNPFRRVKVSRISKSIGSHHERAPEQLAAKSGGE
jgi:hypothetical protein